MFFSMALPIWKGFDELCEDISLQWVCYVVKLANAQCFSSHFVGLIKLGFV